MLLKCQERALHYVASYASRMRAHALPVIDEILRMSNMDIGRFSNLLTLISSRSRVALHFHPDRPSHHFRTVAENLLEQGVYKNQFETGLSAGSVTAYAGGARDKWERAVFDGAYHTRGVRPEHRPKYGALNLIGACDGPSPRFGSCFFLLNPEVTKRCTFTYLDSHKNPEEKATAENFEYILSALLYDAFFNEHALGTKNLTVLALVAQIERSAEEPIKNCLHKPLHRNLNQYIEAQVHGNISLAEDVDYLIADSTFRNTTTGEKLVKICDRYSIDLYWRPGLYMKVIDVPTDFRGVTMPSLAAAIAKNGAFNTKMIGDGVMSLKKDPMKWSSRGSYGDVLQEFKLLWHVLVKYGEAEDL